ncbi:MAG: hypothetical protein ACOCP8_10195, partial [archaeon]
KKYFDDINDIYNDIQQLPANKEGYIVQFDNKVRIKMKSLSYLKKHKLLNYITPLAAWRNILNQNNLFNILSNIPEEHQEEYKYYIEEINKSYQDVLKKIERLHEENKNKSNKELGLYIEDKNDKIYDFLFARRKKDFFQEIKKPSSKLRKSIFNLIKPKNNILNVK